MSGSYFTRCQKPPSILADNRHGISSGFMRIMSRVKWIQKRKRRCFSPEVEGAIAPFIKDRGFDWEFHVDETPFDLWTIQGIRPPRAETEDEKRWIVENRASPRTHA